MNVRNFDLVKGMKMRTKSIVALLLATITMAPAAVIPATSYNDTIKANFSHPISNVPGTSLNAVEVSYPPGGASAPHRHSDSAFIYAYVVSGQIASQVEGQPEHIYRAGECWYETPGAHHLISATRAILNRPSCSPYSSPIPETMPWRPLITRAVRDESSAG